MIQLPTHVQPDSSVLDELQAYQNLIVGTFLQKQALVLSKNIPGFASRNTEKNSTFIKVREKLTEMCSGIQRCAYCENAPANEVEHIYTKKIYPDRCFDWNNYLYSCGSCNKRKSVRFAIFEYPTDTIYKVLDGKTEPPAGESVLINPRLENGMDFCRLNLRTFHFEMIYPLNTKNYVRANYTFNIVLKLNTQREKLIQGRQKAYKSYRMRLGYYSSLKEQVSDAQRKTMIDELQEEDHQTVWREIKRSHQEGRLARLDPDFDALFLKCPEALNW